MNIKVSKEEKALLSKDSKPTRSCILRPVRPKKYTLDNFFRPPNVDEQIAKESEHETKLLNEKYAKCDRKVSQKEAYELKLKVKEKHENLVFQSGLRLALWNESERILNILRTKGMVSLLDSTLCSQRRSKFIQQFQLDRVAETNPESPLYWGFAPVKEEQEFFAGSVPPLKGLEALTPNEYFIETCPDLVRDYGYAFYTAVEPGSQINNPGKELLMGINTDFFAAYVGGDKRLGHDVVFFVPEARFYFYDSVLEQYMPTSEEKIQVGLSLALQQRSWGLEAGQAQLILTMYRSKAVLEEILGKAKALLATEQKFFEGPHARARFVQEHEIATDLMRMVRTFVKERIEEADEGTITITDCVAACDSYCQSCGKLSLQGTVRVQIQAAMEELHGKRVRHDLVIDGRCTKGWKGLRLSENKDEWRRTPLKSEVPDCPN